MEHKHSKKRDAILACIKSTDTHPTAEWVYTQLKPSIPDLSLGTVYRNISCFQRDGTIVSVGTVRGNERYDSNTLPHAHFACMLCSRVIDLGNVELPSPPPECGTVLSYKLMYSGVCKVCAENKLKHLEEN